MILTIFASVLKLHRLDDSTPLGKYRIGGGNRELATDSFLVLQAESNCK
jgi:hypothetical protein